MPQYRLKTELVDAVQYTGSQAQAEQLIASMSTNVTAKYALVNGDPQWQGELQIKTANGYETVSATDYILTQADGTRYRVSNADFVTKYEQA